MTVVRSPRPLRDLIAQHLYESYYQRAGQEIPMPWDDLSPRDSQRADFYLDADAVIDLLRNQVTVWITELEAALLRRLG